MRIEVLFLAIAPMLGAQQSVHVTSAWPGRPTLTLPNAAPWTTIGLSTNPMRWELRIHDFGTAFPAYPSALVGVGAFWLLGGNPGTIQATDVLGSPDVTYNNGPTAGFVSGDLLIRVQRDVANSRYTIEVCGATGGNCTSGTAAITTFGPPSWARTTMELHGSGDNRDYYTHATSFDGTSGTGTGLLSARPATCTTGVAYWETDHSTLDRCTATNTWTNYYTPYTYPNPLIPSPPVGNGGSVTGGKATVGGQTRF